MKKEAPDTGASFFSSREDIQCGRPEGAGAGCDAGADGAEERPDADHRDEPALDPPRSPPKAEARGGGGGVMLRGGRGTVAIEIPARSGTVDAPGTRVTVAVEIPARSEADAPGTRVAVAVEMPAFSACPSAARFSVLVSCGRALLFTKRCSCGS
jgi:hypothetical protein